MSDSHRLRAKANGDFMRLIKSADTEVFDARWLELQKNWERYPEFVSYVQREWISNKERWASSYLYIPGYGIQTNNLIESWHAFLKMEYLRRQRKQRVDILL